jgi:hypothetical protein
VLHAQHTQPPPVEYAEYLPDSIPPARPGGFLTATVRLRNTGTAAWVGGAGELSLVYHIVDPGVDLAKPLTPFLPGVVALDQGTAPLPHTILPGAATTLRVQVHVPSRAGHYDVVWDLQESDGTLLSAQGVLPHAEPLVAEFAPAVATVTPTPAAVVTPAPTSGEDLKYVADTSVPDGTVLSPRSPFVKAWLVFNDGRRPWTSKWVLRLGSGRALGASAIPIPETAPCHSAVILAEMKAPAKPGRYHSVWHAEDAGGQRIGEALTVVITVRGARQATPSPTSTPAATPTATSPAPTATPVG